MQQRAEHLTAAPPVAEAPAPRLKFVFSLLHPGYLRHYGRPIRLLAEQGHEVHVALGRLEKDPGDFRLIEELAAENPNVSYSHAPARRRRDGWRRLAWLVRALTDLARYGDPRFADAPALRGRFVDKLDWRIDYSRLPKPFKRPLHRKVASLATGADAELSRKTIARLARYEDAIPSSRRIVGFLREQKPDAVLASPVIEFASSQVEYLKAARALGIRTGICVASWDNLTGKGLLRFVPDRVFVWNDIQRQELVEMHGIPADRVVLTGAQRFDDWFDRRPSTASDEFARNVGLDPAQPYVLYLCSSPFIAPDEVGFVHRWLAAVRERFPNVGVLVRPHPQNAAQWRDVDLDDPNAVVWPREGQQPDAGEARAGYFDSLAHSSCVVGVNTSGLIEAGIVGKAVLTVTDPVFAGTQEGTLHFHYLHWENGGLLHVGRDLDEHVEQLGRALEQGEEDTRQVREFVERFTRPHGLDRPAAPLVAQGIEELGHMGAAPKPRGDAGTLARRTALYPVALTMTGVSYLLGGARQARKIALGAIRR
jgi:hypothetical protein